MFVIKNKVFALNNLTADYWHRRRQAQFPNQMWLSIAAKNFVCVAIRILEHLRDILLRYFVYKISESMYFLWSMYTNIALCFIKTNSTQHLRSSHILSWLILNKYSYAVRAEHVWVTPRWLDDAVRIHFDCSSI